MIASAPNFFTYYKLVWILIVVVILTLAFIFKIFKYKQKLEMNYVLLGTGLIFIASVIAFILDPIKEVTTWGLYSRNNGLLAYISLFLLIYLISSLKVQRKHVFFMVHAINIVSVLFVIIAIFQFFGIDIMNSLWYKKIYTPNEYKHLLGSINVAQQVFYSTKYYFASSVFGQYNYFGAYCSVIYPLITAFSLLEDNFIKKTSLIIGSIMLFTATILAQSLGSIFTLFNMIIIIPVFLVNKRNYKSFLLMLTCYTLISVTINRLTNWRAFQDIYRYTIQILSSKLLAIIVAIAIIYILLFIFRKRILRYSYILVTILMILVLLIGAIGFIYVINNVAEQNMEMLSNRGYVWHYSNELVKEKFIFGYGPDNMYYNFPQINDYQQENFPDTVFDKPHNMYLQLILDTGIFGLIGFMILLVGTLLKSNKAIEFEKDIYIKTYFKALMLVIVAYMIQGIVNDNTIAIQSVVYMLMGIGASLITQTFKHAKLAKAKE
jgi:O-antigen ligase